MITRFNVNIGGNNKLKEIPEILQVFNFLRMSYGTVLLLHAM